MSRRDTITARSPYGARLPAEPMAVGGLQLTPEISHDITKHCDFHPGSYKSVIKNALPLI